MPSSPFNLSSPNRICEPCQLRDLSAWFVREVKAIPDSKLRLIILRITENLDSLVRFPGQAMLLWQGCDRIAPSGKRLKYHCFPSALREEASKRGIRLDSRPNGPAIASFLFAGGTRELRFGSTNSWSIHHLYSGKFPYVGMEDTLHAPKEGNHFTQSAGLVAVHPIADALCDEVPAFSWLLRAMAFKQFGYDPDRAFSNGSVGELGFPRSRNTKILFNS